MNGGFKMTKACKGKYTLTSDKYVLTNKLSNLEQEEEMKIMLVKSNYRKEKDLLIEEAIGIPRGRVLRYRQGGKMNYKGYYRGILNQKIHLEICLSDGSLTGKNFFRHWVGGLEHLEDFELKIT